MGILSLTTAVLLVQDTGSFWVMYSTKTSTRASSPDRENVLSSFPTPCVMVKEKGEASCWKGENCFCLAQTPSFHQVRSFPSFPLHPSPVVEAYAWCLKGECKSQTSGKPELLLQPLFNSVFDVRALPCSVPSAPSFGAAKLCWALILNIAGYVRLLKHWCGKSHSHLSIANGREKDWFFHGPAAPKGNITDSQKWGVTRTH